MDERRNALLAAFLDAGGDDPGRIAMDIRPRISYGAMREDTCFGSLHGAALILANELHDMGIRQLSRVAWIGPNDMAQIVLFFACARLGAILLPLNWRLSVEELRWIERDAMPALVCAPVSPEVRPDPWGHPYLDDLASRVGPETPPVIDPLFVCGTLSSGRSLSDDLGRVPVPPTDTPVLMCYTSGTTGRPKGVVLTQDAILANAAAARRLFGIVPTDRVLTVLPMFHVGGFNIQTIPALLAGAEVVLLVRFEPDAFFDAIAAERPTLSLLVPAAMAALVAHPRWAAADLSCLRAIGAGSSDVPVPLIHAFHAKGVPVQNVYGSTETSPIAIAQTCAQALAKPGSIGRPVAGVAARLAPATGEIEIRGPNVMLGYWRDNAGTDAALRDGWFATGDVGRVDADGDWWFTDRLKHLIISGGENISPAEVERVLAEAPGVREGAVVGRPDPRWGEVPVAVVVPGEGFDPARVLAHFEGRLARFKHPRAVLAVPALPRTALGKVAVAELRRMVAEVGTGEGAAFPGSP